MVEDLLELINDKLIKSGQINGSYMYVFTKCNIHQKVKDVYGRLSQEIYYTKCQASRLCFCVCGCVCVCMCVCGVLQGLQGFFFKV